MTEENGLRHDERGFLTGGRRLTPQQEIDEPSADLVGMRSILERIGRGIDRLVRLLSAKAVPAVPVARRGPPPQRMAGSQHGGSARTAAPAVGAAQASAAVPTLGAAPELAGPAHASTASRATSAAPARRGAVETRGGRSVVVRREASAMPAIPVRPVVAGGERIERHHTETRTDTQRLTRETAGAAGHGGQGGAAGAAGAGGAAGRVISGAAGGRGADAVASAVGSAGLAGTPGAGAAGCATHRCR